MTAFTLHTTPEHWMPLWRDLVWFQLVTHHHRSEAAALARELGETSGESGEENYVAPLIRARVVNFASPLALKNLKANFYGKACWMSGILFPQAPASSCRTWKIIKENEMRLFYIFASALKAVIFLSGSCILSLDASIWSWGNGVPDRISQDSYKILVLRGKM